MKATHLVVGSNCFTGAHIVDALLDDPANRVVGVSRSAEYKDFFLPYKRRKNPAFEFRRIDIVREMEAMTALLDEVRPRVVVFVAALSEVGLSNFRPAEYYRTNTEAVARLCDHLRQRHYLERYVQISTPEVYGSCPEPLKEGAPYRPSTPYAVSKAAADMHLATLHRNFGFPCVLIRSTNVYGRHQQLFKIIPRTVIYLRLGRTIELHGGGAAVKTWVHVRDVVDGILKAIEKGRPGEIYHFADEHSWTVRETVRRVCAAAGRDFDAATRDVDERLGQDARYVLDWTKAREELGWRPRVRWDDGIREVIEWIEENWDEIRNEPLEYVHRA